jgi:ABC-type antimicrobial peptide transport system permease subunit
VALDTGKDPSRIWGFEATGNYFDMLGIQPYLGRFFHPSDEKGINSAPYIVLSYAYWHSHFLDDRSVAGRVVRLNGHPYTVLGVTPPDFHGTFIFFAPNFYVPMVNHDQLIGDSTLNKRMNRSVIQVLGHLRQGVTRESAIADLDTIGAGLAKAYPKEDAHEDFSLGRPSLPSSLSRPVRAFVSALMLLAGLILLAACANLGSLFAARASDRSREVALRHGCVFGQQEAARTGDSHRPRRAEARGAADRAGTGGQAACHRLDSGLAAGSAGLACAVLHRL